MDLSGDTQANACTRTAGQVVQQNDRIRHFWHPAGPVFDGGIRLENLDMFDKRNREKVSEQGTAQSSPGATEGRQVCHSNS